MNASGEHLTVKVNGEPRTCVRGSSVADLLRELGLKSQQVAVERNKRIVRRPDFASTTLADGDQIEVVTFFGGG